MTDVVAIILAAGLSRRMEAQNKLLLPIMGIPMIRHMVSVYGQAADHVLVVAGYEADAVCCALEGSGAQTVLNEDYAQGQQTSVICGLRAAAPETAVLIGLGDQPLLTLSDLVDLQTAHLEGDPSRISIPQYNNLRGNPILIPACLRAHVLADPESPGCKKFTRANPDHVQFHALPSAGFYADVDTPDAYAALAQPKIEVTL